MSYLTRRARIEAERIEATQQARQLRHGRAKSLTFGLAGVAAVASVSVAGITPASASLDDTTAPATEQTSSTTAETTTETASTGGSYTVRSGDTLSAIASAQGVSLNELMTANGLDASSVIYPGDTLQLSGSAGEAAESAATTETAASTETAAATATAESTTQTASTDPASTESALMTMQTASTTSSASGWQATAAAQAISIANSGASYSYGGNGPTSYDCSGFTSAAFAAAGIDLPRTSGAQYSGASQHVSLDNLQVGDLVFWSSNGSASGIYHVAVYVGDGQIAQARNPQAGISVDSLAHYQQYNPPFTPAARFCLVP
ncbi:MAG: C40 family peptidase [Micrococcaceae bacterium]